MGRPAGNGQLGRPAGNGQLGRPRRRWIFKKWDGSMDWTDLVQNRGRYKALLNVVMNVSLPFNAGKFLTSCLPVRFSGMTLLHGVS